MPRAGCSWPTTAGERENDGGVGDRDWRRVFPSDPAGFARWYQDHLGIEADANGESVWRQEAGATVFAPFPLSTDDFGQPQQAFMITVRVGDLDALALVDSPASDATPRFSSESETGASTTAK